MWLPNATGSLVRPYWTTLAMVRRSMPLDTASRSALSARIEPGAPLNVKWDHEGAGARRIEIPFVRCAMVSWSTVPTPDASMVLFCSAGSRAASSSTR